MHLSVDVMAWSVKSRRRASQATSVSYQEESDASQISDEADSYRQQEETAHQSSVDSDSDRDSGQHEVVAQGHMRSKPKPTLTKRKLPNSTKSVKSKKAKKGDKCDDDDSNNANQLKQGVAVATRVEAPTTGHVPDSQISTNVLHFLKNLERNNDREWFAQHDAVYRYGCQNFTRFVEKVMEGLMEIDETIPWLPVKDVTYRIYRDVRFSNDKTPYKTNFMASFSRGGRKGPFAGYHVLIAPSRSFFGVGRWQPEKEDLAAIRNHILNDTDEAKQLHSLVEEENFIKFFGPPSKGGRGQGNRSSLWGGEDELKVAPKIAGVNKHHPEIEWLKLRSFVAIRHFDDAEVLKSTFQNLVLETARISQPLVTVLNQMTSPDPPPPPPSESGSDQDQEDEDLTDQE